MAKRNNKKKTPGKKIIKDTKSSLEKYLKEIRNI